MVKNPTIQICQHWTRYFPYISGVVRSTIRNGEMETFPMFVLDFRQFHNIIYYRHENKYFEEILNAFLNNSTFLIITTA